MTSSVEVQLVQNNGRGSAQVWIGHRVGAAVHVRWGKLGGKLQATTTDYEAVNEGKKNERKPAEAAQDALDRLIKLKKREGYDEQASAVQPNFRDTTIDFDDLPPNLCFYKPNKKVGAKMQKLMDAGKAVYTRKRNGEMFNIVINSKREVVMYSRRMHKTHDDENVPWAKRFPVIVEAVESLNLQPRTILLVEMVMDRDGKDDYRHVSTILRSLTVEALEKQRKGGILSAYVWDAAFFNGQQSAATSPVKERHAWIKSRIPKSRGLLPLESFEFSSEKKALDYAKKNKLEGFVAVDPDAVYEDRAWNFKGKPDRPAGCVKVKPTLEGDFLVDFNPKEKIGEFGNGSRSNGVGCVAVYAKLEDDELRYIGNCGGGLSKEQIRSLADLKLYPMVWEIEFVNWTPKGILYQPRFLRTRPDKELDDIHTFQEEDCEQ